MVGGRSLVLMSAGLVVACACSPRSDRSETDPLIHVSISLDAGPGATTEASFESLGLDLTGSVVTVDLTADADVTLHFEASGPDLRILDGRPSENPAFCEPRDGGFRCQFPWPILEAQHEGTWTLVAENRSVEFVDVEVMVVADR